MAESRCFFDISIGVFLIIYNFLISLVELRQETKKNTQNDKKGNLSGRLVVKLFKDEAPKTAENFERLCRGEHVEGDTTQKLWYKNCVVHRVIPGFMFQTGDFEKFFKFFVKFKRLYINVQLSIYYYYYLFTLSKKIIKKMLITCKFFSKS